MVSAAAGSLRSLSAAAGEALPPSPREFKWSAFCLSPCSTLPESYSKCCRGCLAGLGRSTKLRSTLLWWQMPLFTSLASSAAGARLATSIAEERVAVAVIVAAVD